MLRRIAWVVALATAGPLPAIADGTSDLVVPQERLPASIPPGPAPRIDGERGPGEWAPATSVAFGAHGGVLQAMREGDTLYVAFSAGRAWPRAGRLLLRLLPEGGEAAPGAVHVDYEPREHDRAHLLVTLRTGTDEVLVPGAGASRARVEGSSFVELALRLPLVGVPSGADGRRRVEARWEGAGDDAATDLGYADLSWTGEAAAPAGWERLVAEEAELARRGETAHATAFLIGEEPNLKKRDVEMEADLFGNLAWIAEREPLTAKDLVVLATGHRFLNRPAQAIAVLEGTSADPLWRDADPVLYQRALAHRALERFEEAESDWMRLHARSPERGYDRTAALERERARAFEAERRARDEDDARGDLPLVLVRTDRGEVFLRLFPQDVPKAVAHFLALVEARSPNGRRTYDGTCFHRVIGGFVAQGGDPASRIEGCDRGGTGEAPAVVEAETNPRHGFFRGAVGFARGRAPENGSEFFVLTGPRPELAEKGFTCFGRVVAGMEAVDRIEWGDRIREVRVLSAGR